MSLVSRRLISRLGLGSKIYPTPLQVVQGLADVTVNITEAIELNVVFDDGADRWIECLVCSEVPHELLLGLPFMTKHNVTFVPRDNEFYLMDSLVDRVISTTSGLTGKPTVFLLKQSTEKDAKEDQGLILPLKHPELLHPVLQKAFNCRLVEGVNFQTAIKGLIASDKFQIDTSQLGENSAEALGIPAAYVNSTELIAEPTTNKGFEQIELSQEQREKLDALLLEFDDIFANTESDVGSANFKPVEIRLISKQPIASANYRTPLQHRAWLKDELAHLTLAGIIEESESPWNSPTLVVPKKLDLAQKDTAQDGSLSTTSADPTASKGNRLVIDFRKVNEVLGDSHFPIPRIQDLLVSLQGSDVFSCMDVRHAFYTIELHPDSRAITAFSCEFGKFQFRFLPQGLKISPAIFQQRIHTTLAPFPHTDPYMDDISVHTKGIDCHFVALREDFTALRKANFKLKKGKCLFFYKQIPLVGHIASKEGISIDPEKSRDIEKMIPPKTVGEVRTLMGFVGYLRDHIHHFNDITGPIHDLIQKGGNKTNTNIEKFWDSQCDLSFKTLKETLASNQVLKFPETDVPYELFTDASGKHMSGVLLQSSRPIGYFARSFKGTQTAWAALTKEAYAVYRSVEFFAVFIAASQVTLRCDHKPLARFLKVDTRNQMVNRWSINMQQYDIVFKWVATDQNISDCLSRLISTGLYVPHEPVATDFDPFPKYSATQSVMQIETLRIKTAELPKAFTLADMKGLQKSSGFCKRVTDLMRTSEETNKQFTIHGELLCKIVSDQGKVTNLAVVIPPRLGLTAIVSVHLELAHAGESRTLQALRSRVYWRGMTKDIRKFVAGCTDCQIKALKKDVYPTLHGDPGQGPWLRLAIDIAGANYGTTPSGNSYVFTAICTFSQYPFAVPISDKTSATVCKALMPILGQTNRCVELLSDNGPEFRSHEFAKFVKAFQLTHRFTAPHCPKSNGVLERWHRYLNSVVRLGAPYREDNNWEDTVEAALKAYRCTPHSSSRLSPHQLAFGFPPRLGIDMMLPLMSRTYSDPTRTDNLIKQLEVASGIARKNVILARLRNKSTKKPTASDGHLKVGDMVTMRDNNATKGQAAWKTGFQILKFEGPRTVQIQQIDSEKPVKIRVSVDHLKKTEPLAILLQNSNIDLFPGASKLYLPAQDMPDLNWPAEGENTDLDELMHNKMLEAVRDRSKDVQVQDPMLSSNNEGSESDTSLHDNDDSQGSPQNTNTQGDPGEGSQRVQTRQQTSNPGTATTRFGPAARTRSGRTSRASRLNDFVYMSQALQNYCELPKSGAVALVPFVPRTTNK